MGPYFCGNVQSARTVPVSYNMYFGDLHTHTSYSDAWEGTPWDAYQAAIDAGADYMAITDHASIWNAYSGLTLDSVEWADTLAAADHFTSKKFVAMPAYEAWLLGHLGEINVYNVEDFHQWTSWDIGSTDSLTSMTGLRSNLVQPASSTTRTT